ncbi:hypothetical protein LJX78_05950 [Methanimicrococcus blatticola]|uniref:hypothetical protein n=1 Tax=Methanimicrococcus blatticola TaxID=91560 RepID=UPI001E4F931E|nr:hypothetical protein [Methanimicrococcus blatticola]MCC2509145.1 hypothetical protein [Methanimicrococcus blatticola]
MCLLFLRTPVRLRERIRCHLTVYVAAATLRFVLPPLPYGLCCRCYLPFVFTAATPAARERHKFKKEIKNEPCVLTKNENGITFF